MKYILIALVVMSLTRCHHYDIINTDKITGRSEIERVD